MPDIATSVLAKLKNKAKASGISYQHCLQLFMQEEFLRRLSKTKFKDFFVLKGGLLIYNLTKFESRATIDVDFLFRKQYNTINDIVKLIEEVIMTSTGNNYILMEITGYVEILPHLKYNGVSVQIIGRIKNVRVPFNIDIGVGDVIIPNSELRTMNTQLVDFEAPKINTYSLESIIAEKLDAIFQRFELTGRMKDFYDIYYIAGYFNFDGKILQSAIYGTLKNRKTPFNKDNFIRISELVNDTDIQTRWKYFQTKSKFNLLKLDDILERIKIFLEPVYDSILAEENWIKTWIHDKLKWV